MISLPDAVGYLQGEKGPGARPLAVITIDDGFYSTYAIAYPILCRERIPVCVFPVSGLVDGADTLWYCRLHDAVTRTRLGELRWGNRAYRFSGARQRARSSRLLQEELKRLPHPELLRAVETLCGELGLEPREPLAPDSPFRMLTAGAISEMASSGLVHFGAHTHTHAILSRISSAMQETEIRTSIDRIKGMTGSACVFFSFPNGTPGDYTDETVAILRRSGIAAAVTASRGINRVGAPPMELKRCGVDARTPLAWFRLQAGRVAGAHEERVMPRLAAALAKSVRTLPGGRERTWGR